MSLGAFFHTILTGLGVRVAADWFLDRKKVVAFWMGILLLVLAALFVPDIRKAILGWLSTEFLAKGWFLVTVLVAAFSAGFGLRVILVRRPSPGVGAAGIEEQLQLFVVAFPRPAVEAFLKDIGEQGAADIERLAMLQQSLQKRHLSGLSGDKRLRRVQKEFTERLLVLINAIRDLHLEPSGGWLKVPGTPDIMGKTRAAAGAWNNMVREAGRRAPSVRW